MFNKNKKQIFGSFEQVIFPDFAKLKVIAKVDTGAWNGAIHATNIREIEGILNFNLLGKENLKFSSSEFKRSSVTSASGHKDSRYLVKFNMRVRGQNYQAWIGLKNREKLSQEMLIGRRFLLENHIIVDVSRNHKYSFEQLKALNSK